MSRIDQVAKNFEPAAAEARWYACWMAADAFVADAESDKAPYTIVMPPPNITGQLHMGHALDAALQDVLIRYKRLAGFEALWVPGTDHAAIATEARIVAQMAEEDLTKEALGREAFLERAWAWREQYGRRIVEQQKRLGASCDWSRERFTMDEGLSHAVQEVFIRLYEKQLIYRGERIINWCPSCLTSLSDAEVEHENQEGQLWYLRYPLSDGSGDVVLATTRPETMLGDTAVAVHPGDERYRGLIGKHVCLPLVNREIPVVADTYVDPEFGTGVVKITPAHDPNDFEVGLRHDLPVLNILTEDARISEAGGAYAGLTREVARRRVVEDLRAQGFLVRAEKHSHNVGSCYRCSTTVEPRVSLQWFVKMEPLAKPAIAAVESGQTVFVPEHFDKIYFNWMNGIRDWCISRQLWWGHRIPAYYCADCGEMVVARQQPDHCAACNSRTIVQDPDTLDTWFSSALWPFSTLGWPEKTRDLQKFYPTDVLVTGYDIIFFWVARMIFSGIEQTGQTPFHTVFIHGIVRDEQGRKMSKSLDNGIDPLEIIDQAGADALRFALINGTAPGNDQRFQHARVEYGRNLINKLWNAFRFAVMNFDEELDFSDVTQAEYTREDRWILSRLQQVIAEVSTNLDHYELGLALEKVTDFLWDSFCDWYIEIVKTRLARAGSRTRLVAQSVLNQVLVSTVTLLHPFMPFVTEEIYHHLIHPQGLLIRANWPQQQPGLIDKTAEASMQVLMQAVRAIREIRANMNVPPSRRASLIVVSAEAGVRDLFAESGALLERLAGISECAVQETAADIPATAVTGSFPGGTLHLPLAELIDIDQEIQRLDQEIEKLAQNLIRLDKKLQNAAFVEKAPAAVVQTERDKRAQCAESLDNLRGRVEELRRMQ